MCGISVILGTGKAQHLLQRLMAMHAVIPHRGPDGEGFLVVDERNTAVRSSISALSGRSARPRLGFAFRRLKICDLTEASAQPMGSADEQAWIVFNGEIYNFRELRRELEAAGVVFRTQGDTEVVLAAYTRWGAQCFSRLEGMWAIVIADLRRNRLVISRDRFGIKPLYWTLGNSGELLLSSEIKQLLAASCDRPRRSNRPLIEMFLRGERHPTLEETFFEGIQSVPAASWCEIDLAAPSVPRFQTYWNLADFTAEGHQRSYSDALSRAEALLERAVQSHRLADVKVGALLSGGLDSSTLVALAHRNNGLRLPTYSLGYRLSAPRFCEMPYVDSMTIRDGIENHETTLDASWVATNTDRVLWSLEEPPLAMPAFAQFRMFQLCALHGATVVLDGQGADEIAGGYQYHQRSFIKDRLLGGNLLGAARELRAIARKENRKATRVFGNFFVRPYFSPKPKHDWVAVAGPRRNAAEFEFARTDHGHDESLVNRQLYFDVRWGNVKVVLGYGDRNAMAHSIEARVPFFDREFVEFMFSLPDTFKTSEGQRKRILRDVARKYVPREITERADRMGYGTPDEQMIRGPLASTISDALNDPGFRNSGWIVDPELSQFLDTFRRGRHNNYRALWRLFVLSRWAARFSVAP